jgi:hypothetical protein
MVAWAERSRGLCCWAKAMASASENAAGSGVTLSANAKLLTHNGARIKRLIAGLPR